MIFPRRFNSYIPYNIYIYIYVHILILILILMMILILILVLVLILMMKLSLVVPPNFHGPNHGSSYSQPAAPEAPATARVQS